MTIINIRDYTRLFKSKISLQGSRDNMSIVLVTFPAAPKPNPEAQRQEAELEMAIARKIKGSLTFPYFNSLYSLCCCINSRSQCHIHHESDIIN